MLITDILLLDYKRCQRRAFLNRYGNPQEREPDKDFLLKLRQENQRHIDQVLAELYPHAQIPASTSLSWQERANATRDFMKKGVDSIYQGVLSWEQAETEENESLILVSSPHLLIKCQGESQWGDWLYISVNIQLGRRPKPEYKLVASLHAYLLAKIQGILPPISELILRPQKHYQVELSIWLPRLEETLQDCWQMLSRQQEPEVFISRQRCSLCHWYSHCYEIAQSQEHLSLVPGVTPNRYESLQILGLNTITSLATASNNDLREHFGLDVGTQLQQQAQSLVENRAIRKFFSKSAPLVQIPTSAIELYFDIEAEPELNLDYLLGILLVNRGENTQQFYSFLAKNPEEEALIWQEFLNFVNDYTESPIFHYSEYEVETLKRLSRLYNTSQQQLNNLVSRCFDLHQIVTNTAILPVENYSLKTLANWLGFHWREAGVSGDQCVCWYDQWLKTGNDDLLKLILRYNEDDCYATFHLKNWLKEFLQISFT